MFIKALDSVSNSDELTDSWPMVDFTVLNSEVEIVSDLLWSLGVVAVEERVSSSTQVVLRTSMGDDPDHAIATVRDAFPQTTVERITIARSVADTWREHAVATWVNDDVALVPAWISPPDNCTPIFVEPLDTFGLGNHPTTVLTLRLALQHVTPESTVFDLGCGSGVLAVGLALLRQCTCTAYDIADNARKAVEMNSELNDVATVTWIDGYPQRESDAVLANILAPVLIEESHKISSATKSGGLLFLSGMRTEQVERVLQEFTLFKEISRDEIDGWTAVCLQKI
jgi:ribosomal protein L11 methylase PrmA